MIVISVEIKMASYIASFPGLSRFYLPFAFTIIHRSEIFVNLPIPCIIVNANGRSKRGRPGTEATSYTHVCTPCKLGLHVLAETRFTLAFVLQGHN